MTDLFEAPKRAIRDLERELAAAEAEAIWLRGIVKAVVASLREHGYADSARRIEDEVERGVPSASEIAGAEEGRYDNH